MKLNLRPRQDTVASSSGTPGDLSVYTQTTAFSSTTIPRGIQTATVTDTELNSLVTLTGTNIPGSLLSPTSTASSTASGLSSGSSGSTASHVSSSSQAGGSAAATSTGGVPMATARGLEVVMGVVAVAGIAL